MEKRKLNKKKVVMAVLCVILIMTIIIGMIKNRSKTVETSSEEVEQETETVNTTTSEEINFLENLEVPVYKKSEKDIQIPILIYHNFRTPIPYQEDVYRLFSSQENFDENVKTLLDAGYTFITLEDLYQYNKGQLSLPEKVIIITMDDGQIGCYTDAFPVLKKYQIPATIFIVNQLVGTEDYCHGYHHSEYSSVGKEKLISDYTKSHQEIEEHMGEKVQKIMAYPAGKSSDDTIKWLKAIGFEVQVQTKYGTVNKSRSLDLTGLGRIRGERATGKEILSTIKATSH